MKPSAEKSAASQRKGNQLSAPRSLDDAQVIEEIDRYQEALMEGRDVNRQSLIDRFPEIAEELRACLEGLEFVQRTAGQLQDDSLAESADAFHADIQFSQLGEYRIIREIGRGGMGVVYEAEQISLRRRVALKVLPFASVLDRRQLQRFHNEAQAAATLRHPNIVGVYAVGCERGVHYYAMEYIEGSSLDQLIRQLNSSISTSRSVGQSREVACSADRSPSIESRSERGAETTPAAALSTEVGPGTNAYFRHVANLGVQAAEALEYAHDMGIVHRDIKPSNLIVDSHQSLSVADFGLAQIDRSSNLTMTGELLGTLRYMSPEQISGQRILDHRTDVYSLGATLYELLTHQPAFPESDRNTLIRQLELNEPIRPRKLNPHIPPDLETIVLKAMAKEPEGRYQTAQDLSEDLNRFLERKPVRARRASRTGRLWRWVRRNATLAVLLSVIALLVTVLAVAGPVVAIKQSRLAAREAAARKNAEEARKNAEEAHEQTERNRRKLQEMLDRSLTRTASALQTLQPGQQQLLDDTLNYYDGLLHQRGRDPEIRYEVSLAYSRLGFVCAHGGQRARGERLYGKAFDLLNDLVSEFPSIERYRYELSETHRFLGGHATNHRESLEHHRRAVALLETLVAEDPSQSEYRGMLVLCRIDLAFCLRDEGHLNDAERHLRQAAILSQTQVGQSDRQNMDLAIQAYALSCLGQHYLWRGQFESSRSQLAQATRIANQLGDFWLQSPERVAPGADTFRMFGVLLCCLRRPKDALPYFRKAVSTAEQCLTDYPHASWPRKVLASAYHDLGGALLSLGRHEEAEESLRSAVVHWRRLIDGSSRTVHLRMLLGLTYFRLGRFLWWTGRRSEAGEEFRRSISCFEETIERRPDDRVSQHLFAHVLALCPDPQCQDARRAARFAEAALRTEDEASWRVLGGAFCRAGRWERAREALSRSIVDTSAAGDAYSWLLLSMTYWHMGYRQKAYDWHRRAADAIDHGDPVKFGHLLHPFDLRDLREEVETLIGIEQKDVPPAPVNGQG